MRTSRIEAFSDGVFAIAITLLALDIARPKDAHGLGHQIFNAWPEYLAFVISFLLVGLVWANHHAMFDQIARGDRMLLFINVLLLMDVAVLPVPTSVLAVALHDKTNLRAAVVYYGAVLTLGGVFFNALWWLARKRDLLRAGLARRNDRTITRNFILGPITYAVSTVVGALVPVAGLLCYGVLIMAYWLPITGSAAHSTEDPDAKVH